MKKETILVLKLIVALIVVTGCTKTREAELPDDAKENVYAISDFGTTGSESFSANKIEIDSATPSLKALDDSATLSSDEVTVPARLKFMFDKLPLSRLTTKNFKITFTVDKNYVTSYKIVSDANELSVLERGLAITVREAQLLVKATKSTSAEAPQLFKDQKNALTERKAILAGERTGPLAVPLFKYKIEGYGIIERTKNELKENTSVLQLKKTDFKNATHIQITSTADSRLLVGMNPEKLKELGQLFDEKKLDNRITTVGSLQSQLKVGLGFMSADEQVFTRLDADVMHVYKITKVSSLNEFGQRLLKTKSGNQQVLSCSDQSVAAYFPNAASDCVLNLAADFSVSYVSSQLTLIDDQGNTSNEITFNKIPRVNSVGLVSITENTPAVPKYISGTLDPKHALKKSDIIDKEFFFRRTFEDAPSTSMLMPGLAGDLILAKFVLEENRIVVKATEKFINYKNENSNQFEDLMAIDAKYYKLEKVDANGTVLTIPKMTEATMYDADYIILDWTKNSLPIVQSPLSMTTFGQCLGSISNTQVSDVVYKNDGELILNFTYNYTAMLRQECATYYDTQNYNGGDTAMQQIHAIRERISFRENKIKKADEKIVSAQVPFPAQNKMGYGLFTKGIITPTVNGNRQLADGQLDLPIVHDFTNGQQLVYTIGGLADSDPQRQMIIDLTLEVIADWNKSLHLAFKGTPLAHDGVDYIVGVVNGERDSEKGFLGDTDKNFIWYDDKINEGMSVIGVSQAGSHPRTGTIIADQVVMYLGNSRSYIEGALRNAKIAEQYKKMLGEFEKNKLAAEKAGDKTADPKANSVADAAATDAKQSVSKIINAQKNYVSLLSKQSSVFAAFKLPATTIAKSVKLSESTLNQLRKGSSLSDSKATLAKLNLTVAQKPYIKELFAKIADAGTSFTSSDIDSVLAREILKANNQVMTAEQKSLLKMHVQLAEAKSNLNKIFLNRPGCATFKDETEFTNKFTNMTFEKALTISLKATLAHEMGHSLGLTHNFIGSSDKANWENGAETTGRNYSSIMDYQDESRQIYVASGPYDVHALRAGYTGLIEINATALAALNQKFPNSVQVINNKNFVRVETIKAAVAGNSWANLNRAGALTIVKNYKYCTDKDLMWEADCRQFDLGGSKSDIVSNAIADYKERYGVSRFGYDRREFGWAAKSRVLGRSFDSMLHIRQYLDEAFYKLILERDSLTQAQTDDYVEAAVKGWAFFQEVIGTPDAPAVPFLSADRFAVTDYTYVDKDKKEQSAKVLVEMKALRDLWSSEDRLETIGMEEDKIMAMQLLTLRGIGFQKYAMHSLAFSYLDLEKYLLGVDEVLQMPTVQLLKKLSMNKLSAFVATDKQAYIPLISKNEVTEAMRVYSGISSIISLEAQALSEKDNYANLFKVGSTLGSALKDRISLSPLDNPAKSKAATYYWAPDNSSSTETVLSELNLGRLFLGAAVQVEKPMKSIVAALLSPPLEGYKAAVKAISISRDAGKTEAEVQQAAADAYKARVAELRAGRTNEQVLAEQKEKIATAEAELLRVLTTLNKQGAIATAEKIAADPQLALANKVSAVSSFIQNNASIILQVVINPSLAQLVPSMRSPNTELGEMFPLVAIAQKALSESVADVSDFKSVADKLLDTEILENKDNMVMKNIDFLNMLTVMVNPGFNR